MKTFIKHAEHEQDFELNIASIIDCFVVLIAFILVSTSFFSISILDAEVAGAALDAVTTEPSETAVIELKANRTILVKYGANRTIRINGTGADGAWNFAGLSSSLGALKEEVKELDSAILVADNSVTYRDVMASMTAAKTKIAKVNLGGF